MPSILKICMSNIIALPLIFYSIVFAIFVEKITFNLVLAPFTTPAASLFILFIKDAKHEMSIEDYGTEYVEDMKADSVEEAIIKENVDEAIVKLENGEVPSTSSTRPVKGTHQKYDSSIN